MNVILLSNPATPLFELLKNFNEEVILISSKIKPEQIFGINPGFMIAYGYPYIIPNHIIDKFPKKIINLHISYLPWNKGAEPVFWSFLNNTPKGVSIHYVSDKVDSGNIIVQKEVGYEPDDTLQKHYDDLNREILILFKENWKKIRSGQCSSVPQKEKGSFHFQQAKENYLELLKEGHQTSIKKIIEYSQKYSKL